MDDDRALERTRHTRVVPVARPRGVRHACFMEVYGPQLGRKVDLVDAPLLIGRDPDCDIAIEDVRVSRHHARIVLNDDGTWGIIDQNSTNGTWVNDRAVQQAVLHHGDLVRVGNTVFKYLSADSPESAYFDELYRMVTLDGLTGAANKRRLAEFLGREFLRARRHHRPLSVAILDIDHFKDINDTYGHLAGDRILRELAQRLLRRIRRDELLARYGGEEFVVVLPETTKQGALHLAEDLRRMVAVEPFEYSDASIPVTVSIGVAQLRPDMHEPDDLLEVADRCLYEAKRTGRNRVCG